MAASRIPLDLSVEVTSADGTRYKWDANQAPGSRLTNVTFSDKIGEGFSAGGGQLARRIDQDYSDLDLVNTVTFLGADGSTAYEGRLSAMPRELGDRHSIGVTLTGWMAHARDRPFREIYVDRDRSAWQKPSASRQAALLSSSFNIYDPSQSEDPVTATATLDVGVNGAWVSPFRPVCEAWYDAGSGLTVGAVYYSFAAGTNVNTADANWHWSLNASTDDLTTGSVGTGELRAASASNVGWAVTSTTARFAYIQMTYGGTPGGTTNLQYTVPWSNIAVYGNAPVNRWIGDSAQPPGVLASEVIADIANRFCPELDTSGVNTTDYVIQHLVFKDLTDPYDAFLAINAFHLWHLGVWEDKRLDFRPYDLTDYDWEIRTDDPGTTFQQQGASTENLFNGITVTYTDLLTGRTEVLTPDVYSDLRDTSDSNPWNKHGLDRWDKVTLSRPTIAAQALQMGRATLAERNRPRAPGTITVRGYIRDRAGNYQPYWKVRSGDTIAITNHPNDAPRLIVETEKDVDSQTVRIAVDLPFNTVEAAQDRVENALTAAGLS